MTNDRLSIDPSTVTILNVDDSEAARYFRTRVLRSHAYRILEAKTGKETLHMAAEARPDLLLLDVRLPDMGSLEICRALKADPATASIMLLCISANATRTEDRVIGLHQGADGYLIDPIDPAELLATVQALLRLKRSEDRLRESEEGLRALAAELEQRVHSRTLELERSQKKLRALTSELNLAEQRERKRLATELHDHLQQLLVLGKLKLGQGKRLAKPIPTCVTFIQEAEEVLTQALGYTRTLVAELSPPVLHDHGLTAGLKWLGEYMKKYEMAVQVTVPEEVGWKLPEDHLVLLFQCVKELLFNSLKYAGTGRAAVRLIQQDGRLRIDVRDEGDGFDPAEAESVPGGSGVKIRAVQHTRTDAGVGRIIPPAISSGTRHHSHAGLPAPLGRCRG